MHRRARLQSCRRMRLPDYHMLRGSLEDYARVEQAEEVEAVNEVSKDTVKFLEQPPTSAIIHNKASPRSWKALSQHLKQTKPTKQRLNPNEKSNPITPNLP